MSNVVLLFPRAENAGGNVNEIREGADMDDLIAAWAETLTAAVKLEVALRQQSNHFDTLDHLIDQVEDHKIRELFKERAIESRKALMKETSRISKNIANLKNIRPWLGTDRGKSA
jgi:hypothetical protein